MNKRNIFVLSLLAGLCLPAAAQQDSTALSGNAFQQQTIDVGAEKTFSREQSTSAASVITRENVDKRSAKDIGNSILGQGNGLISLDGTGTYFAKNPTFYVRGLQSLSTSTPLILIDGIEREISVVAPEDVESVTILKDAAATALYGYKGINGAVLITTKRGKYNSNEMSVHFDHLINYQTDRPKFIDGATYASAMNEALANEGKAARYDANALAAFQSGQYPYQYPNVDWVDETFRHHGVTNKVGIDFSGGGERFRYYTSLNLLSDKGFIKTYDANDGYSTQDKYVRGNLRINLDIDLTPTTMLKANISGLLSENSQPGSQATPWSNIYNLPSAAFPIKSELGDWGGNSTWAGTLNPVALTTDAAYYKTHERALFADMTLTQDLSGWVKGLGFFLKLGYDTYSTLYEDHSKGFVYGSYPVTGWNADGSPALGTYFTGGERTEMSKSAATKTFARRLTAAGGINFDRAFGDHYVYSQLKWDYDYQHYNGSNNIIYRQNYSWWTHYAYKQKYIAELAMTYSGSSRLAPDTKWAFAPTFSAAWVISKENFMKDIKWLDYLKLRASIGKLNADYLPDDVWTYYTQSYSVSGASAYYFVDATAAQDIYGTTTLGTMATVDPSHEKATKFNIGFDATLFKGLNVEFDYFYNHRYDIWCSGAGAYTAMIGFGAPYVNQGVVNQYGFDASIDFTHKFGDVTVNVGGNMTLSKSEIKDMAEEPRAYDNLVQTGNPLNSIYGLISEGLFTSQAEIDAAPRQTFTTVRPGDIRYKDVNGDGVIDANDKVRIGYSVTAPELYYSFHLGAEYKGLGLDMMFQGVGRYSAVLNTQGYYWGLISNSSLAQQVYDNRWSPSNNNANAEFPRLSSESNANNYQTSDFWLRDRSYLKLRNIELYYHLPKSILQYTKIINSAKVYLRGVDLFTFDHLDEVDAAAYSATTPLTRSIALGVSVTL